MHPTPGLATSLAMQAYLRHHGTPVCLHELLVKTVRQQGLRAGTAQGLASLQPASEAAATRDVAATPDAR